MLTGLSIRDVVLIESLDLEFGPGLGVLTGETGAGKSILLDALGLALGTRADSGLVRHGQAQAVVSASFDLPAGHAAIALLAENGLEGEPGEPLVIRRLVRADGGSRGGARSGSRTGGCACGQRDALTLLRPYPGHVIPDLIRDPPSCSPSRKAGGC